MPYAYIFLLCHCLIVSLPYCVIALLRHCLIASTVTNPANLVEGVAQDGWVRGGAPTRDMFYGNGQCNN